MGSEMCIRDSYGKTCSCSRPPSCMSDLLSLTEIQMSMKYATAVCTILAALLTVSSSVFCTLVRKARRAEQTTTIVNLFELCSVRQPKAEAKEPSCRVCFVSGSMSRRCVTAKRSQWLFEFNVSCLADVLHAGVVVFSAYGCLSQQRKSRYAGSCFCLRYRL